MPTAESLVQPFGPISASLFPDDTVPPSTADGSLLARLTAYIATATTKAAADGATGDEAAITNWALHVAFDDAHTLAASKPSSETYPTGLGGVGYNAEQLRALAKKAAFYLSEYEAAIVVATSAATLTTRPQSRQSTNLFDW